MKKCLIFIDGEQVKESLDLIEVCRKLYPERIVETYAVSNKWIDPESLKGIDHTFRIDGDRIKEYDTRNLAYCISKIQDEYQFDSILIPATWIGRMLAPRLSILLQTGLTADVTEIQAENDQILLVRPAYSGRMMASIKPVGNGPVMMSVRANVFHNEISDDHKGDLIPFSYSCDQICGIREMGYFKKEKSYDIRESKVLISGGGGVIHNFEKLEELAQLLNGQVAASRKIVDKGIAPRYLQVGQSGKTVSPKLYFAFGISGAIQHIEGLKNVETVIAVNSSINAPICSIADLVVEGDACQCIELLLSRIRQYKEKNNSRS